MPVHATTVNLQELGATRIKKKKHNILQVKFSRCGYGKSSVTTYKYSCFNIKSFLFVKQMKNTKDDK